VLYVQRQDNYQPASVPKRIVSIVPSQTELLYYLGIQPLAQTIFCVHPKVFFKQATKIGGTKKLKIEKILALEPDLVLGNKEENEQAQIEELAKHTDVWLSDIYTLKDAYDIIRTIGRLTNSALKANTLANTLEKGFKQLSFTSKATVLYLIWKDPYMAVGRNTFINEMLEVLGYTNVLTKPKLRYPEITISDLKTLEPDHILLSSEPFPFKEKHIEALQTLLPESNIKLVDGELFSWYGNRLLKTLDNANSLKAP
jgi:ABC-type Fe3+-hydroxamate transport system substrate-binding protein